MLYPITFLFRIVSLVLFLSILLSVRLLFIIKDAVNLIFFLFSFYSYVS
jgi:hypothetical protein